VRERISESVGMHDTAVSVLPEKVDGLATSYASAPATGELKVYDASRDGDWSTPPAWQSGTRGLASTADDYRGFGQMLLNQGTHARGRVLSSLSVEL
jgi:CubicO group peptidase (beta-lactamase class C family)